MTSRNSCQMEACSGSQCQRQILQAFDVPLSIKYHAGNSCIGTDTENRCKTQEGNWTRIGYISDDPFKGSVPLFVGLSNRMQDSCAMGIEGACHGDVNWELIGYIFKEKVQGSIALKQAYSPRMGDSCQGAGSYMNCHQEKGWYTIGYIKAPPPHSSR